MDTLSSFGCVELATGLSLLCEGHALGFLLTEELKSARFLRMPTTPGSTHGVFLLIGEANFKGATVRNGRRCALELSRMFGGRG
jgi:hypothetical protein